MKLVCFGDSLTWGEYGGSYVNALRAELPSWEIINAGEGGNTVVNLLRRVERDVLAHEPDGVFVMIGGNDAISYSQPKVRPYYRQRQGIERGYIDMDEFEAAYRDLLTQLQLAHLLVWIGLPPIEYSPDVVAAVSAFNERARRAASAFNIPTFDLLAALNPPHIPERKPLDVGFIITIGERETSGWNDFEGARQAGGFTYTFDGLHFTPEGAAQAARLVAQFLTG